MKKLLLSASALATMLIATAEVLSPEQALNRLASEATPMSTLSRSAASPRLLKTTEAGGQPAVYLFEKSEGYIMVAADDIAPALLGYSDEGTFTAADINPTMQWWMEQYAAQIDFVRTNGIKIATPQATPARAAIAPLVKTHWDQSSPYNDMTPLISGEHPVTGCVATATAQVLKYHEWPVKGTGTHTYTPKSVGSAVTFNYGATTFDWANMLDSYTSSATQTEKDAVATLMLACGVGVDMNYGLNASGAQANAVAVELYNYFNYDGGVLALDRDCYGFNDWNDLIYDQLQNYGPVQYSGTNDSSGHSFVCDGYSQDNYFHINWGWGGMSDGYFLLTALDPDSQGIGGSSAGYNLNQSAIAYVKPADPNNPTAPVPYLTADELIPSGTTVQLNSVFSVTGLTINCGIETISGSLGFVVTDSSGNETFAQGSQFEDLPTGYGYSQWSAYFPKSLTPGTYSIQPVAQVNGVNYPIHVYVGAKYPKQIRVNDSNLVTFIYADEAEIEVSDFSFKAPIYLGKDVYIDVTVSNTGDTEYLGTINLVLANTSGTEVALGGSSYVDVAGNSSETYLYSGALYNLKGQTLSAGTYTAYFIDKNGNIISDKKTVEVKTAVTTTVTASNFTLIGDKNSIDPDDIEFTAKINCTSGYFSGNLWLLIFSNATNQLATNFTSPLLFIEAGKSENVTFKGALGGTNPGDSFGAAIYDPNAAKYLTDEINFTVKESSGVEAVVADEDVTVSYFNLQGVEVKAEKPVPGIYVTVTTSADGSTKIAKTVIR